MTAWFMLVLFRSNHFLTRLRGAKQLLHSQRTYARSPLADLHSRHFYFNKFFQQGKYVRAIISTG